ncbi:MAG: acyl-CoA dehydrogenase [Bacteroidia bacterium]
MTNPPSVSPLASGNLSSGVSFFLPLIYIAWSDEVLTPSEIEKLESIVKNQNWLDQEEKAIIIAHFDPKNPPSRTDLNQWKQVIVQAAENLPVASRTDIIKLSREIAGIAKSAQHDAQAAEALRAVEDALGLITSEAVNEILHERHREFPDTEAVIPAPGFNPAALQLLLDGPEKPTLDKMRRLLSDPVFSLDHVSPVKEEFRETVLAWCKLLADQGLGALSYPIETGGENNMSKYIAVFEGMGYHDLSLTIKFGVQFGLFGGSILGLGTEKHHLKYLPDAGSLKLPGCFAMTEANHGSNVRDIETTATYDHETEEFIIHTPHYHAHKEYIGNAAVHGRMATVFAQLYTKGECYGVHAILVPVRDENGNPLPGVTITDSGRKLGLNGVDNGRLWFDQVRVPRENLLNRFADVSPEGEYSSPITSDSRRFFTMLGTLVGGRVCVPVAGLSAAKTGLTIAIRYGSQRRQFGPAGQPETFILDYQTHQRRLFPLLANAYAYHFAHRYMISRFLAQHEEEAREIEALAAGLKAMSTWNTTQTLQECREACGGNGYLAVNRFADLKADTEIFTTFEGDNTVLMQLVAKSRLTDFRQEFSSLNFFGIVNYAARQAAKTLLEQNPFVIRTTGEDHLRDSEFHLAMFRYREQDMIMSSARRLKQRIDGGMDSYQAFIEVQYHLVGMAEAYVDRVVLEQFVAVVEKCEDNSLKTVLKKVCDLYALSRIEAHFAWYLENDYLAGVKSKAIRSQVNALCRELRPEAVALVDAFGIPDALLAAPIGQIKKAEN